MAIYMYICYFINMYFFNSLIPSFVRSPSDSRNRIWSSELAKHLQFGLVDTAGMTEDQLREIPYTVVETNSKRSTMNMKIHKSGSKGSVGGKSTGSGNTITNGSGSTSGQGKNRVDRIRG